MYGGLLNRRNLAIAGEVEAVAGEIGATPSQVAIAWLLGRKESVVPIVGARRAEQMSENLKAVGLELDLGQRDRLDGISRIEPGFPHDFLAAEPVRDLIYGGFGDRIIG